MSDPINTGIPVVLEDFPEEYENAVASISSALDLLVATESTPTQPATITQAPSDPFISPHPGKTYAWIVEIYGGSSWEALTYGWGDSLWASGSYFGGCRHYGHHPLGKDCSAIYTACSDGTLSGPVATHTCTPLGASYIYTEYSTCVTDLYYTTYGAENAFSSVRCGPAYGDQFLTPNAMTLYRESPTASQMINATVQPTAPVQSPSLCDSYGRPCPEPYRMNDGVKAAIAVGVFMGVIALVLACCFLTKRKKNRKQATMNRIANNYALEEMDPDGVKPPKYDVAVAEARWEGSSSGHTPAGVVPSTDPPLYRP